MPCPLPSIITTKVLKNCQTFSSRPTDRDQDQDQNVQDQNQDQDFIIQDFHFCPRGASRPRPWSRGLHHCFTIDLRSQSMASPSMGHCKDSCPSSTPCAQKAAWLNAASYKGSTIFHLYCPSKVSRPARL